MPSIIEIILQASDQTGPAFASARANLQGLQAAQQTAARQASTVARQTATARQQAAQSTSQTTSARQPSQTVSATQAQRSATAIAQAEIAAHSRVQSAQITGHNRIEAQRLSSVARVESAQRSADARVTAAERASNARVESERIRAENRIELLQRRQAASGGALPRTFAGFTGGGALQAAGALGIATAVPEVIGQMGQLASAGQDVQVSLDGTRASLGALLQSQSQANDVFDRAIAVGQQYGQTQQETAAALQASALLIRDSSAPIEQTMTVLMRLASLNPAEGVQGAAFALAELASGDIVSLNERFRIGREEARAWRNEIMAGADPIAVLDRGLQGMNITNKSIEASLAGAAGEQRRYNQALEGLQIEINNVARASGVRAFLPDLLGNTATEIRNIRTELEQLPAAFQNLIPAPVMQALQFVDRLEDRLSGQLRQSKDRVAAALGTGGPGGSGFGFAGAAADAPVTPPPQVAPRRMTPYANTMLRTAGGVTMTPQAQGAVINNYTTNLTVQGSLVHTNDVIDTVNAGQAQQAQRTGSTRRR